MSSVSVQDVAGMTQDGFASILNATEVSQADMLGMWSTISLVKKRSSKSIGFWVDGRALVVDAPSLQAGAATYLADLSATAHEAATALLCGSILGGQGSESDDFSDCCIFLGELSESEKKEDIAWTVLKALGLEASTSQNKAHVLTSKTPPAPVALETMTVEQGSHADDLTSRLVSLLKDLQQAFEFRLEASSLGEPTLHFVIGKGTGGWQGLMGASVSSDD